MYSDEEERWYVTNPADIKENESNGCAGKDGEKYCKGIGCFEKLFVGLRMELVVINTIPHIAHFVLIECPGGLVCGDREALAYRDLQHIAFSPDGMRLALVSGNETVEMWNVTTGALLQTFEGGNVESIEFSPEGTRLALVLGDSTVRILDITTGASLQILKIHHVYSVAFSPDGTHLALAGKRTVGICDVMTGALLRTLEGHTDGVYSVAFSLDGARLASASEDGTLKMWDIRTAALLWTDDNSLAPYLVEFSPDGRMLACASDYDEVRLYDAKTYNELQRFQGLQGFPVTVRFSPDSKELVSAFIDKTVRRWNIESGSLLSTVSPAELSLGHQLGLSPAVPKGLTNKEYEASKRVRCLKLSPVGTQLAVAFERSSDPIRILTIRSNKRMRNEEEPGERYEKKRVTE